jgi:NhaA family Na+:H+ antiporter
MASGVHATVAGVLLAMVVPVRAHIEPSEFLSRARRRLGELEGAVLSRVSPVHDAGQREALDDLYLAVEDMRPPGITLEHQLHPLQAFLILPLFALFKAGVALGGSAGAALADPVAIGIVLGLFAGKQAGIFLAAWLVVRRGLAPLPTGVTWSQLWGAGCLGGIGFTMAIFVSELAFTDPAVIDTAKIGVLAASVLAGVWGFIVLRRALPKTAPEA